MYSVVTFRYWLHAIVTILIINDTLIYYATRHTIFYVKLQNNTNKMDIHNLKNIYRGKQALKTAVYNSKRCEKRNENVNWAITKTFVEKLYIHVVPLINSKLFPLFIIIKRIERVYIYIFNDHYVLINTCDESRFQKRNRPTRLSTLM